MEHLWSDLNKLRNIYLLKSINRSTSVGERMENPAEHSWSAMVLAEFFLQKQEKADASKIDAPKIDRLRVLELLLFHDLVEIETGDICITKQGKKADKEEAEKIAMDFLAQKLPQSIATLYKERFIEYLERKTIESRFAQAIDSFDAELHEMDYKKDWKGWTEEFLRGKKKKYFEEFPFVDAAFEETTRFARENGYFVQK